VLLCKSACRPAGLHLFPKWIGGRKTVGTGKKKKKKENQNVNILEGGPGGFDYAVDGGSTDTWGFARHPGSPVLLASPSGGGKGSTHETRNLAWAWHVELDRPEVIVLRASPILLWGTSLQINGYVRLTSAEAVLRYGHRAASTILSTATGQCL